ncbi:MAG: hypothetical protein WDN45_15250 [Caulobacteraceae bacterium]
MGSFLEYIVESLLGLVILAMVVNAILSWLIAFDVVNMRNRFIYQLTRFLDAVTRPPAAAGCRGSSRRSAASTSRRWW